MFPLSYTRYVLHYLVAASASFQEEKRTVRLESMREREEQKIKKRWGKRKSIIVDARDGGINSKGIGGREKNTRNKNRKKVP